MRKTKWRDPSRYIRHVHVAEEVVEDQYCREILARCKLPYTIVPEGRSPEVLKGGGHLSGDGKKHLFLCNNRGHFFKPCPGTLEYQCCEYHVLSIGANCPMDCVYCILQAYLDTPWITHYTNINKLYAEISAELSANPATLYRVGTGEFTDSLALETITQISSRLVPFFSNLENGVLELKTKCASIESLQGLAHNRRTIVSWSLNAEKISNYEEIRAASIDERLEAAGKCADWGYGLGFHFDPIIHHPNWKEGYKKTIQKLFDAVPAEAIVWISLGALRYLPSLKEIAVQRFPRSRMFFNEFITGLDGKARYFRTQREEMYHYVYNELMKKVSPDTCIYFCMESEEMWRAVMGVTPENHGGVHEMLNRAAAAFMAKH